MRSIQVMSEASQQVQYSFQMHLRLESSFESELTRIVLNFLV